MDDGLSAHWVDADQETIEDIAHALGRPVQEVQVVYVAERGKLERIARIKDYVPVLVNRRVRNLLQADERRSA